MGSTYLELVNKVLLRVNEVPLNETNFTSARGLHATVKEIVRDVISRINKISLTLPFNAAEHTLTLIPGIEEYAWPSNFKEVDWESFQIQKDVTLNIGSRYLNPITRDEWYELIRDRDYDSHPEGVDMPSVVFKAHGNGFGVSPSPNKEYPLKFRYYMNPPVLKDHDDRTTIPEDWEYVIIIGSLYWIKMFKDDDEQAAILKQEFKNHLDEMKLALTPVDTKIRDTRVKRR